MLRAILKPFRVLWQTFLKRTGLTRQYVINQEVVEITPRQATRFNKKKLKEVETALEDWEKLDRKKIPAQQFFKRTKKGKLRAYIHIEQYRKGTKITRYTRHEFALFDAIRRYEEEQYAERRRTT